jgi:hypothetical protein
LTAEIEHKATEETETNAREVLGQEIAESAE